VRKDIKMPELPEVETVARQLRQKVLEKKVVNIEVFDPKVVDTRLQQLAPFKFKKIQRRGKSIIASLDNNQYLIIHFGMTGHFYYVPKLPSSDTHNEYMVAVFHFADKSILTHNSIRRFGRIQLATKTDVEEYVSKLGPEPLEMTSQEFILSLQKTPSAVIKSKLLDQDCIAGIGNIYAQEALYRAGILPSKKINQISQQQLEQLYGKLQDVLRESIKNNGTTVSNFTHLAGKGEFQNLLTVYQKDRCPKNHSIRKVQIGGRSTYYCKDCQK